MDLYFFFSSRRRHTRCGRDWSSDVCSSDLSEPLLSVVWMKPSRSRSTTAFVAGSERSEERRVGKECRSQWSQYHYKKKEKLRAMLRRLRQKRIFTDLSDDFTLQR